MLANLCAPTLIYIAFSLTQIFIDTFKGLYNTAFFKLIVMIIIGFLLNALCSSGMTIISWIIVFIPFIFMSVIVAILLYVFGLDAATGKLNINNGTKTGNLIFSRNATTTSIVDDNNTNNNYKLIPNYSTDPQNV